METMSNRLLLLFLLPSTFLNGFQVSCLSIRPDPCSDLNGVTGTCMFVWDCIKGHGKHIGTCTDRFLFGSCCSHNSSITQTSVTDLNIDRPEEAISDYETLSSLLNLAVAISDINSHVSPEGPDYRPSTTIPSWFSFKPPIHPRPSFKPVIRHRPSYKPVSQFKPTFKPYHVTSNTMPTFSQLFPFETSPSSFIYLSRNRTSTKTPPQEAVASTPISTKDSYLPQKILSGTLGYVTSIQINEQNKHWFRPTQSTSLSAVTNNQGNVPTRTKPQINERPTIYSHPRPSWKPTINNSTFHKPYIHYSTTEKQENSADSTVIPQLHLNHSLQNNVNKPTVRPSPQFSQPGDSTIKPCSISKTSPISTMQLISTKPPLRKTTISISYPFSHRYTFKPFSTSALMSVKNKQNTTEASPLITPTNRPLPSPFFGGHTFKPFSYPTADPGYTIAFSKPKQSSINSIVFFQTISSLANSELTTTATKPSWPVSTTTTPTLIKPIQHFIKTNASTSLKPRPSNQTTPTSIPKPSRPISVLAMFIMKSSFLPNNWTIIPSPTKPSRPDTKISVSPLHNSEKSSDPAITLIVYTTPASKPTLSMTTKPSRPVFKPTMSTATKPSRPAIKTSTKLSLFVKTPSISSNLHRPFSKPMQWVSTKITRRPTKTTTKSISVTLKPNLTRPSTITSVTSTTPTTEPQTTRSPVTQVTSANVNEERTTTNFPVNVSLQMPPRPMIVIDGVDSFFGPHTENKKSKTTTPLPSGALPSILQEVQVPIISNEQCKNMFLKANRHEYIPDIFICAGFTEGGRDSCQGDSGGPLQLQSEDGSWFLAGIISWGIGCAEANMPGVCTRISKFKDWLQASISEKAPQ